MRLTHLVVATLFKDDLAFSFVDVQHLVQQKVDVEHRQAEEEQYEEEQRG